jgi:hypothetical protein
MPALGLVAALTLPSAACSANPAAASPAAAAMSAGTNPLPPAPAGYHKVGLTWVLQNVVGETFGPTQRTGYGKGRITGLSKGCPECSWYRVNIAYSDQQPTAAQQGLERPTTQRLRDFCWPWENYIGSGCAGWNSAWTWNWSDIWHTINGDWHPWDPQTTIDRVQNCIGGITEHITVFVLGPHAAASVFEGFGEVELTPGGAAYAAGASCAVGIVK